MRHLAVVFVAIMLLAGGARAASVGLRSEVVVNDTVIRLGDLFPDAGEKADRAVGYAPKIGRRTIYDATRLLEIARANGLDWRPRSRFDRAVIERASQTIRLETVEAAAVAALAARGIGRGYQIVLDNRNLRLVIPPDAVAEVAIRNLRHDAESGRFTAVVSAPADTPYVSARISGRAYRMAKIPVPVRRIARGEVIDEQDIGWVRLRAERVGRDIVSDPAQLIGMAPRRGLMANEPVRVGDIHPPVIVAKGSLVTVMLRTANMTLTVRGRALEDGARGTTIKVMNTQSKMVVEAAVVSPDVVAVQPLSHLARVQE